MKNYAFLFLPLMLLFCSCEQLSIVEYSTLEASGYQPNPDKFSTQAKFQSRRNAIKVISCDLKRCDIKEENLIIRCLKCAGSFGKPEQVIEIISFIRKDRVCDGVLFSGCEPPMPLEEFVVEVDYGRESVSGKITDDRGKVFAQTSARSVSYDEESGKAYLSFEEVNPELSERSLNLTINTNYLFERRKVIEISLEGELGEEGFVR